MSKKFDDAMDSCGESIYDIIDKFIKEHSEARGELEKKVNPPPRDEDHLQSDRWA